MVRISKEYDVRKREIIDTAMKLFLEHGYDNTPVSLIIDTVGISKGTFYYYFKSKEELLDSLVTLQTKDIIDSISAIVSDSSKNAIEKLNAIFLNALRMKAEIREIIISIIRVWMKDENILIRHKMERESMELSIPLIDQVIGQGIEERLFDLPTADGVAELILKLGTIINDQVIKLYSRYNLKPPAEELVHITSLYQLAIERILGAPKNSIKLFNMDLLVEALL